MDFYTIAGISINFRDTNFVLFSPKMEEVGSRYCEVLRSNSASPHRCNACDQALFQRCARSLKMEIGVCRAGMAAE